MMQEPIEDRRRGGNVAQQLAPIFQWPIGGHHGRTSFIATHHDLEQELAAALGKLLHPEVINDQQVRFEIPRHYSLVTIHRFVMQQIPNHIEDAAVVDLVTEPQ
jgi:hypothetical protein